MLFLKIGAMQVTVYSSGCTLFVFVDEMQKTFLVFSKEIDYEIYTKPTYAVDR